METLIYIALGLAIFNLIVIVPVVVMVVCATMTIMDEEPEWTQG